MAAFEYQALDTAGRTRRGVVSADSPRAARKELRRQSLTPLKLAPTREKSSDTQSSRRRLPSGEVVLVTRQLAMLIESGTPVEEAIAAVGSAATDAKTRTVLASIRSNVVEGRSLSDALRTEHRSFNPLYRSIVSAGEEAGALGGVMDRLADYLERSQAMRRKVLAAMIYPLVLALVALSVVIALMVFVVPRVVEQFDTLGADLPALTDALIAVSAFLRTYGAILLGGLALAALSFHRAMKSDTVKRAVDHRILSLPILGRVARSVAAARFSRTFATLAISGAPVLDCLAAARETTPNLVLRDAVDETMAAVREGGSLSKAMARTGQFPPLMVHMAASGEASGDLGGMFAKGAEYLESDFETASSVALGLLEPIITVVMGGMVLVIILAIMLPILQLNSSALF
ncbi:MAG: type II secretion system inner membrane protein GspF [Pseudomonadota bacterium]